MKGRINVVENQYAQVLYPDKGVTGAAIWAKIRYAEPDLWTPGIR